MIRSTGMELLPYYTNPWIELYRDTYQIASFLDQMTKDWAPIDFWNQSKPYFDEAMDLPPELLSPEPTPRKYPGAHVCFETPLPREDPTYLRLLRELEEPEILSEERIYEMQKEINQLSSRAMRANGVFFSPVRTIYDDLLQRSEEALWRHVPDGYLDDINIDPEEVVNGYPLGDIILPMTYHRFRKFTEEREPLSQEDFETKYANCRDWITDRTALDAVLQLPYSQRMLGQAIKFHCRHLHHSVEGINATCVFTLRRLASIRKKKLG